MCRGSCCPASPPAGTLSTLCCHRPRGNIRRRRPSQPKHSHTNRCNRGGGSGGRRGCWSPLPDQPQVWRPRHCPTRGRCSDSRPPGRRCSARRARERWAAPDPGGAARVRSSGRRCSARRSRARWAARDSGCAAQARFSRLRTPCGSETEASQNCREPWLRTPAQRCIVREVLDEIRREESKQRGNARDTIMLPTPNPRATERHTRPHNWCLTSGGRPSCPKNVLRVRCLMTCAASDGASNTEQGANKDGFFNSVLNKKWSEGLQSRTCLYAIHVVQYLGVFSALSHGMSWLS